MGFELVKLNTVAVVHKDILVLRHRKMGVVVKEPTI